MTLLVDELRVTFRERVVLLSLIISLILKKFDFTDDDSAAEPDD